MPEKYKSLTTQTHVYFLSGPFSQWHPSEFMTQLYSGGQVLRFSHAEQYMMASKADLFGDYQILKQIMDAPHPRDHKELGRQVQGFSNQVWNNHAQEIVYQGNLAKFSQDSDLREYLISTGDRHLVEGAWYDPVWGVGLAWNDPLILDSKNWKGTNWLGICLMKVREHLKSSSNS